MLGGSLSKKEFLAAVESQRAGAAAGDDDLGPEILKQAPEWLLTPLFELLLATWETECPLQCLKTVILAPLIKDNSKSLLDPANYRPIALIGCILKLFESILTARLTNYFEGPWGTHFLRCDDRVQTRKINPR